jgi:hypothetical protein
MCISLLYWTLLRKMWNRRKHLLVTVNKLLALLRGDLLLSHRFFSWLTIKLSAKEHITERNVFNWSTTSTNKWWKFTKNTTGTMHKILILPTTTGVLYSVHADTWDLNLNVDPLQALATWKLFCDCQQNHTCSREFDSYLKVHTIETWISAAAQANKNVCQTIDCGTQPPETMRRWSHLPGSGSMQEVMWRIFQTVRTMEERAPRHILKCALFCVLGSGCEGGGQCALSRVLTSHGSIKTQQ